MQGFLAIFPFNHWGLASCCSNFKICTVYLHWHIIRGGVLYCNCTSQIHVKQRDKQGIIVWAHSGFCQSMQCFTTIRRFNSKKYMHVHVHGNYKYFH